MAQIFRPNANLLARLSVFGGVLLAVQAILIVGVFFRSNYYRQVNVAIEQPVQFSHQLHYEVLNIDCRYCHTSVVQAGYANIPPTETCMSCHSQIAVNSPLLEPVRASWNTGLPVEWVKVHDLPEFVFFNHSIHVQKGVACVSCHGQVNEMAVVWKEEALFMGWCLSCHRAPEQYIRPAEEVFNFDWQPPPEGQLAMGRRLVQEYQIQTDQLENCAICHH